VRPGQKFGVPCAPHLSAEAAIDSYEAKAARWGQQWPRLTVLPWPGPS
jgi:hypothetical protein